jgi:hypothetical protein
MYNPEKLTLEYTRRSQTKEKTQHNLIKIRSTHLLSIFYRFFLVARAYTSVQKKTDRLDCVVFFPLFGFVLCTPMSVSQDCTFLIAPLVFSNVDIFHTIDLKFILVSLICVEHH